MFHHPGNCLWDKTRQDATLGVGSFDLKIIDIIYDRVCLSHWRLSTIVSAPIFEQTLLDIMSLPESKPGAKL
jgi:hypothetical protein